MKKLLVIILTFFLFSANANALNEVNVYFFYKQGCTKCAAAEEKMQSLQRYYPNMSVYKIVESENEKLYNYIIETYELTRTGVPLIVIGDKAIMGYAPGRESTYEKYIRMYSTTAYENKVGQFIAKSYNNNLTGSIKETPVYMDEDIITDETEEDIPIQEKKSDNIMDIIPILVIGLVCGVGALVVLIIIIKKVKKDNESFDENEFLKEVGNDKFYGAYDDPISFDNKQMIITSKNKNKSKNSLFKKVKLNIEDIKEMIPDYNQELYEDKLFKVYETIQNNLMMDNIKVIKYLVTDEMFIAYALALNTMKAKNQQSVLNNIKLFESNITSIKKVNNKIEIVMYLKIKCKNYVLDRTTNSIIKGNYKNLSSSYRLVFIKELNREIYETCPNCGENIINKDTCEYCNYKLENFSDFVLAKESLIERKVIDGE